MRGAFAVAVTKHAQASAPDTLVGHAHCTGLHVIRSTPAGCSSMQDRYSLEAACTGNYVRATTSLRAAVLTVATGRRTHLLLQLQRHDCDGAHVLQVGFIANLSGERNHKIVQQVRSFTCAVQPAPAPHSHSATHLLQCNLSTLQRTHRLT